MGYYASSTLDFIGLQYISAGLERLILFSYPTFTLIFGAVFFGLRISRRDVAALALCYLGIAVAFAHDLHIAQDMGAVWIGGGFVLASSLCHATYLTGSGRIIPALGAQRFTALAMLVSSGAILLHFLLTHSVHALDQPKPVYALAVAMAIFSTVLPVFAQSAAIKQLGAGKAALFGCIGPIATIGMSWWILDEPISMWQLVGAALVVIGVLLAGKKMRRIS
jgi:drug/metabolite transporter (DMT)-like permease